MRTWVPFLGNAQGLNPWKVVPPFRIALTMRGFGIVRRCGYLLLNPPDKDASSDITSTITSSIDRSNAVISKMILSHLFQQSNFYPKITAESNIGESESNTKFMPIHFSCPKGNTCRIYMRRHEASTGDRNPWKRTEPRLISTCIVRCTRCATYSGSV